MKIMAGHNLGSVKTKVKVLSDSKPNVVPSHFRQITMTMLEALRSAAGSLVVVDRGHRHSSGAAESHFWLHSPRGAADDDAIAGSAEVKGGYGSSLSLKTPRDAKERLAKDRFTTCLKTLGEKAESKFEAEKEEACCEEKAVSERSSGELGKSRLDTELDDAESPGDTEEKNGEISNRCEASMPTSTELRRLRISLTGIGFPWADALPGPEFHLRSILLSPAYEWSTSNHCFVVDALNSGLFHILKSKCEKQCLRSGDG